MYTDCAGQRLDVGMFVVYATKSEAPSLQFGYIEEFKEKPTYYGNGVDHSVRLHRADAAGNRKNKFRSVYHPERPDGQKFETVDTGKPDTVWLVTYEKDDRLLACQPI